MLVIRDYLSAVYFRKYFIAVGLKFVLVLASIRITMTQRLMRHQKLAMFRNQKWDMFRNLVDLAVKLRFYELYT